MRARRTTWDGSGIHGERQRQAKEAIVVYMLDNRTCLMIDLRRHLTQLGFSAPSIYRAIRHLEGERWILRKSDPTAKRIIVESLL